MQQSKTLIHLHMHTHVRTHTGTHILVHTQAHKHMHTSGARTQPATGKFCDTYEKIIFSKLPKLMNFYCQLHCTLLTPVRPAEALSWQ